MNGRRWTAEEDAYLKRSWGSSRKTEEIADHLNRSIIAVNCHANAVVNRELLELQSPNKSELALDALLQANFPGEYRFNGDYSQGVTLGGLIPDWVNVNGKKQVLELFGEYWHDGKRIKVSWKSTEFGRRAVFSQLGFECLIIWGNELKSPDDLVKKIRGFV